MILDCLRGEILHFVQDDIQTPVVPNERSDRGALPKGKDLALPLPCHPDGVLFAGRISALNLDCLRGEILHFVQDDNPLSSFGRCLVFCRPEQRDREASPKGKDLAFDPTPSGMRDPPAMVPAWRYKAAHDDDKGPPGLQAFVWSFSLQKKVRGSLSPSLRLFLY